MKPYNTLVDTRYGRMLANRHDAWVGEAVIRFGEYSPVEMEFLRSLIPQELDDKGNGPIVIEVGAHIGSLTVPLARHVGSRGMVVAFEPQRYVFQLLAANVALNSLPNVVLRNAAVADTPGMTRVPVLDPNLPQNSGGTRLQNVTEGENVIRYRLDEFFHELPRFDLLKADVEGMELQVLKGAEGLIRQHQPTLYVEVHDEDKRAPMVAYLHALGYRAWFHSPPLFSPSNWAGDMDNPWPRIVSFNLVAIAEGKPLPFNVDETPYLTPTGQ